MSKDITKSKDGNEVDKGDGENQLIVSGDDIKDMLSDLQDQYKQNIRQHLYSTYTFRKLLHQNKNTMVHLPKRISYSPRKVTAEILREKFVYDYSNVNGKLDVISSDKVIDRNSADDFKAIMNQEIMASVESKLFKKLKYKNPDLDEEEFLNFFETKILPQKEKLTNGVLLKLNDVIRGINYEFVPSKRKAIKYTNILDNCQAIYEDENDDQKYLGFIKTCEKLFYKDGIDKKYVNKRFKLHGEVIVSDSDSNQELSEMD
ncbi:hypothetical protein QEN19_003552 [Hanseniaspora menglaensis]